MGSINYKQFENAMKDEKSKRIFRELWAFINTNDYQFIQSAIRMNEIIPLELYNFQLTLLHLHKKGKKIILYGTGSFIDSQFLFDKQHRDNMGYLYYPFIGDIPWECMCDKEFEKFKGQYEGYKVISPQELVREYVDAIIVIGGIKFYNEIKNDLVENGIPPENIYKFVQDSYVCMEEKQYFGHEFMLADREGIFIDGGGYIGDTMERFIEWNQPYGYEQIKVFEPDKKNYQLCNEKSKKHQNVKVCNAGLGEVNGRLGFYADGDNPSGSHYNSKAVDSVDVFTIDSFINEGKVTLIKLDIEGFELKALEGAKEVIKKNKPRLAVCVYHKAEDLIQCANLILKLDSSYRLALRMYSNTYCETVLYAY